MLPYFALLAVPSALAITNTAARFGLVLVVGLVYTLVGGLRYQVGMDWGNYARLHQQVMFKSFDDIIAETEPLSQLLFKMSTELNGDMTLTNLFTAAILIAGVLAYARRTPAPWIAVVAATPYLVIAFGMSGVRQAIGVGITLLVLSRWSNRTIAGHAPLIATGAMFHASAGIIGLFYLLCSKVRPVLKTVVLIPGLAIAGWLLTQTSGVPDSALVYSDRYISSSGADSAGSLLHVSFIAIPALLGLLFWKRIAPVLRHPDLIFWGVVCAVALIPLNFVSSTGASRLSLYLYFVPMAIYPALIVSRGHGSRGLFTAVIVSAHFAILYVWLAYANNSSAHLPYQNIVF